MKVTRSVACSKRSDSGERCEVKKAMKSRGGLAFIFSRSFLLRTAPHYLNAWNRLLAQLGKHRSAKREVVGSNLVRNSLCGRRSKGKGKGIRARDLSPSRAQTPPSPSPFNACHAG